MSIGKWIALLVIASVLPFLFALAWGVNGGVTGTLQQIEMTAARFIGGGLLLLVVIPLCKLWRKIFPVPENYVIGNCWNCDGNIEFPKRGIGEEIECPHCNQLTPLTLERPTAATTSSEAPRVLIPVASKHSADVDAPKISWKEIKAKWWHRLALTLMAIIPVLGAVLYLAVNEVKYSSYNYPAGKGTIRHNTHAYETAQSNRRVEAVFTAILLCFACWGTYRLTLWIVFGKISKIPALPPVLEQASNSA